MTSAAPEVDASKAYLLELLATISRETDKLTFLVKKKDTDIPDVEAQSEALVDAVYEMETLLATEGGLAVEEGEEGDGDEPEFG